MNQYFDNQNEAPYTTTQSAELMDFLNSYPWQAWVHLQAEPDTSLERFDKAVGNLRGRLAHLSKLQVASWGVFTKHHGTHGHVLLLGKNRFGVTLADTSEDTINDILQYWKDMMHRQATFKLLDNVPGAARYVIEENTIDKQSASFLSPRGLKLLNKMKHIKEDL